MINLLWSEEDQRALAIRETNKRYHKPQIDVESESESSSTHTFFQFSDCWDDDDELSIKQKPTGLSFDYSSQIKVQPKQINIDKDQRFKALVNVEIAMEKKLATICRQLNITDSIEAIASCAKNVAIDAQLPLYQQIHQYFGRECLACNFRANFRLVASWKLTLNEKGKEIWSPGTRLKQSFKTVFTAWAPNDEAHNWQTKLPLVPRRLRQMYPNFHWFQHYSMSYDHYHVHFVNGASFIYEKTNISFVDTLAVDCLRRTVASLQQSGSVDDPAELYYPISRFYRTLSPYGKAALDERGLLFKGQKLSGLSIHAMIIRRMIIGLSFEETYSSGNFPKPVMKIEKSAKIVGLVL